MKHTVHWKGNFYKAKLQNYTLLPNLLNFPIIHICTNLFVWRKHFSTCLHYCSMKAGRREGKVQKTWRHWFYDLVTQDTPPGRRNYEGTAVTTGATMPTTVGEVPVRQRWLLLFMFCMLAFLQNAVFVEFNPIAISSKCVFPTWKDATFAWQVMFAMSLAARSYTT